MRARCAALATVREKPYRPRRVPAPNGVIAPERLPNSVSVAVFWARPENGGDAFTKKTIARYKNGYVESFNGKLRDELLAREQFDTLLEAKVLIERWRREYNTRRPHSSLGYRPPTPEAIQPASFASATPQQTKQAGVGTCPTLT
jgi:hypothetical protein